MTKKTKKEICHVCKKEKKPYTVFLDKDILSFIQYSQAREDGPICERCDRYFAMTGEFHNATETEFENAKKAMWFAKMMLKWWEKDKKLIVDNDLNKTEHENMRKFEGTVSIARWCRGMLNQKPKKRRKVVINNGNKRHAQD